MHTVKVMLFATLRDYVGSKSIEMQLPTGATLAELINQLIKLYPSMEKVKDSMIVAINREYAPLHLVIPENCEVALFPPVSGG